MWLWFLSALLACGAAAQDATPAPQEEAAAANELAAPSGPVSPEEASVQPVSEGPIEADVAPKGKAPSGDYYNAEELDRDPSEGPQLQPKEAVKPVVAPAAPPRVRKDASVKAKRHGAKKRMVKEPAVKAKSTAKPEPAAKPAVTIPPVPLTPIVPYNP